MPTAPTDPSPTAPGEPSPAATRPPGGGGAGGPRRVFITVAEVSGDRHAAQLIRSLRQLDPTLIIEGHGGPEMAAAGAVIHRDTVTGAAMGVGGALRAAEVYRILKWTKAHHDACPPDLQVGVDSPSMNIHFARAAKARGVPAMQYVAPQLWAWAPWRMKKWRRSVDAVACILPFEEAYFRAHGVRATFVGHPLFDELPADRSAGRGGPQFPDRPPVIGLLPGSRRSEAEKNFARMLAVARDVRAAFPDARFLVPTTPATHPVVRAILSDGANDHPWVRPAAREVTAIDADPGAANGRGPGHDGSGAASPDGAGIDDRIPPGSPIVYGLNLFDAMVPRCDLCVTVSGTATLHVAGFGVPMIVVYHGSPVLWNVVGRWLIRTRTFSLVNLLSAPSPTDARPGDHAVPEFVPWHGPTGPVADLAIGYLRDPRQLAAQRDRLDGLIRSLDRPGASLNTARLALDLMTRNNDASPTLNENRLFGLA